MNAGALASALGTRIVGHRLELTVDGSRLHDALGPALAFLESPAVDATFAVTEAEHGAGRAVAGRPPNRHGRVSPRQFCAATGGSSLPLRTIAPRHDTKWAQALGIVEQVSSYTTEYPSGQTRVENIHRGADLLNNTVVEPGQVFSLEPTRSGPAPQERGLRRGAGVRRRRVLRRLRRWRQPARDHDVQRRVLRWLQGRHAPAAHHLHRPLPGRARSHRQLRRPSISSSRTTRVTACSSAPTTATRRSPSRSTATTTAEPCVRKTGRLTNPVPVTDKTFRVPGAADGRPEQRLRDVERERVRTGLDRRQRIRRRVRPRHRTTGPSQNVVSTTRGITRCSRTRCSSAPCPRRRRRLRKRPRPGLPLRRSRSRRRRDRRPPTSAPRP